MFKSIEIDNTKWKFKALDNLELYKTQFGMEFQFLLMKIQMK